MNAHFESDRAAYAERQQEGYSEVQLENFALLDGMEKELRRLMDSLGNYKTGMAFPASTLVSMIIEDITAVEVDDYIKAIRSKIEEM